MSAPGSGKTTVAAERFGYQRYRLPDRRGVLGLTFNRAAAAELASRIRGRWGEGCLSFPHRVMTFDSLHVTILENLLAARAILWPSGHEALDVRDDYRGLTGYRYLRPPGNWRRVASMDNRLRVVSDGVRVQTPGNGIGNKAQHEAVLASGISSHEDVRAVLEAAVQDESLVDRIALWLRNNFRAIIIDEVYDSAYLDLVIPYMAAESGLSVTLIGDPWQALYGWRGATPHLVDRAVETTSGEFMRYELTTSFRFEGTQMPVLAKQLRAGQPAALPKLASTQVSVALARTWRGLWHAGDNVLPLAFRTIDNATDAALNLLLDLVTQANLGRPSFGREIAMTLLGLDREAVQVSQSDALGPIVRDLAAGRPVAELMDDLRNAIVTLGAPRRPRRLQETREAERRQHLNDLRSRLNEPSLIPGLTVYQAKGQEWPSVGVVLSSSQKSLLSSGLQALRDEDCVLYVALTRARSKCGILAADAMLDVHLAGDFES